MSDFGQEQTTVGGKALVFGSVLLGGLILYLAVIGNRDAPPLPAELAGPFDGAGETSGFAADPGN